MSRATSSSENSLADDFLALPLEERKRRLGALNEDEAFAIMYDWGFWARPSQILPDGDWDTWLVMAGRGFGKTRTGAETVRDWIKDNPIVNIIAPTKGDIHKVILEGPAGIMNLCPPGQQPKYRSRNGEDALLWPNGARSLLFSAEKPERLRGPQCYKLWCDELAAWRYLEDTWDQAMFGLRLGTNPQAVVTTTPKPLKLVKALRYAKRTHFTGGTTYDNSSNLAPKFYARIISKYEGTRLGRQELNAELLEDNPSALWRRTEIDSLRVKDAPQLKRIVVAVDPAVSAKADSDETGIVAAGEDERWPPHYYVLLDSSGIYKPNQWAESTLAAYKNLQADRVVGEVNNGGDLVEANLRTKDIGFAYKAVHATRGKTVRAEPISALYEQGRVHHVGSFPTLEDEMCDWDPTLPPEKQKSPNRMDALVWAMWELNMPTEIEQAEVYGEDISISSDLDELEARGW